MLAWSMRARALALGLKPRHHLASVHAQLDDLQRDTAADGLLLLSHVNHAETTLADSLQKFVTADAIRDCFGLWDSGWVERLRFRVDVRGGWWPTDARAIS